MTDIVPLPGSAGVKNPMLNLFRVPPTDLSIWSYRMVPISPFTTGINPIDFQIDPQEDYIDLSRSYFEIEWKLQKAAGGDAVNTDKSFLINNIAHSIFKQISVRLNGTLISPQTDTYHYKAYIETLLNYNRDDGDTILKPQGWFNAIDLPDTLTNDQMNPAHNDYKALSDKYKYVVDTLKAELGKYDSKSRVFCMVPHIEVFHLNKLLVPNVKIGDPNVFQLTGFVDPEIHGCRLLPPPSR